MRPGYPKLTHRWNWSRVGWYLLVFSYRKKFMYVSYMTVVGCQFFNGFGRYKIDCAREHCLYCFCLLLPWIFDTYFFTAVILNLLNLWFQFQLWNPAASKAQAGSHESITPDRPEGGGQVGEFSENQRLAFKNLPTFKRNIIFQNSMHGFHVNFPGCSE